MNDLTFKKYCLTFLLVKEKKKTQEGLSFAMPWKVQGALSDSRTDGSLWGSSNAEGSTTYYLKCLCFWPSNSFFYIPLWGTLKLLYHLSNTRPENVAVLLSCANVRGKKNSALDTMPHTFTGGISFQPGAIAFETGRRAQRLHRIANSRLEPARNSPDIIAIGDNSWKGSHVSCLESPHSWTSFYF